MPDSAPLVSIGMPVYNGARHLRDAIDSLLAQTFTDFELIISDNASTDGTEAICRGYVERDPRVRYLRQTRNIGAPRNWNVVVAEARGKYFRWASGNDRTDARMLERCVAELEKDPGLALCYGRTQLIDEEGRNLGTYDGDLDLPDPRPSERYRRVREELGYNNVQQALVRTRVLRSTRLNRVYPGGDSVLTAELALYGRFRLLPEVFLFRRQGPQTMMSFRPNEEVHRIFNPDIKGLMKLVITRAHWDGLRSVLRAPIPFPEKVRALKLIMGFAIWDRAKIGRELVTLAIPASAYRARSA